ncbi:TetR/AcrR family transcriptional regulator [Rhodoluna limnophila]|uniref:TetR/AcrR family transcriptional regulator n=1 Tax=Rhodoluna limnophila TaxID=232537 RepID=UPI0011065B38|nr:TetR/AcrR family transcriptional regulator [Rhodoluna limnophila]
MSAKQPRGPYSKGNAKREEILTKAVEAFGKTGYHATSMREIAAACDLSQAGLLHHFPNKEAVLLALVERREQSQHEAADEHRKVSGSTWQEASLQAQKRNEEESALTRLWANLVGEATDPNFPAHEYFLERYRKSRTSFALDIANDHGRTTPNQEDQLQAAIIIAIWDGLQTQWLLDPKFEMRPAFEYAISMISRYSQYK